MTEQSAPAGPYDDLDLSGLYAELAHYDEEVQEAYATWGADEHRPNNDANDPTELALSLNKIAQRRQATSNQLEAILNTKRPTQQDRVEIGHRVTFQGGPTGTTFRVLLVREHGGARVGADLSTMSLQAPVGQALLGQKLGDVVTVQTSKGVSTYTILAIE